MQTIEQLIETLQLEPHPEGGFYRSTMRDDEKLSLAHGERPLYSSIYFLLRSQDISHLHRLQSDEVWYYHGGSALTIHMIYENGTYEAKKLGLNIENGEQPQILVEKGTIFGSSVEEENTFGLVGCMVAPGFDFEDFELFTQQQLLEVYPQHEVIIKKMAFEQL